MAPYTNYPLRSVVAVSGSGMPAGLVALTLDSVSDNGRPAKGGVPLGAAPEFRGLTFASVNETSEELVLGEEAYARSCAACHGATGEGGSGSPLLDRADYANIVRIIAQGQGELPVLGPTMSQAQIDAIAKHVAWSVVVIEIEGSVR
jgi:mono/diheme cytochrome c family protein